MLLISNDPYPNNEFIISLELINKARAAGIDKNKQNSIERFCRSTASTILLFFISLDNSGSITVLIPIPAIARFMW